MRKNSILYSIINDFTVLNTIGARFARSTNIHSSLNQTVVIVDSWTVELVV